MNVASVAKQLPLRYEQVVGADDFAGMQSMAAAGEWGELVDLLIASLATTGAPITAADRDELAELAGALNLQPTVPLARLNVVDQADG